MTARALILTYHAIETGPAPLCLDPRVFAEHLDLLSACDTPTLTISELAAGLRGDTLPRRCVAITFDDGFASVVEVAAPMLLARGMRATVFCVAGHLGRVNDWPTQPARAARRPLATAVQLARLADAGFEIGAHGMQHLPLAPLSPAELRRELLDSRTVLEGALGIDVHSWAHPYGVAPGEGGAALVRQAYDAACTTTLEVVRAEADPYALPRVDAHYVRRAALLRRAVDGSLDRYLRARRAAASARRVLYHDYAAATG